MSTATISTEPTVVAPEESIIAAAAKALDDRKSKLDFAKQVEKSRAKGTTDADFADALLTARVQLAYGPNADVETYAKDFQMSASKVSQYGTTINQLREAKAPLTEDTFADWFKMTATGGSAKARTKLIADLTDEENADLDQAGKARIIRATREAFIASKGQGAGSPERQLTVSGVLGYLEKVTAQDWDDTDRAELVQALYDAAAALEDGRQFVRAEADPVEAEQVAA